MGNSYNRDLGNDDHRNIAAPPQAPPATDEGPREIFCGEPWFTHIREGRKPVEVRRSSDKWSGVAVGDTLLFRDPAERDKTFLARVTGITRNNPGSLRKYLEAETPARARTGVVTVEAGEATYRTLWARGETDESEMLDFQVEVVGREA